MRFFISILSSILAFTAMGAGFDNIHFTQITKNEGLSDNHVECIFKDADGFMWFGTRNGLCRFDGYEIKVYRKNDQENSLSGNRILDITQDREGYLWIGTYKDGLNRFDKTTETFTHFGPEQGVGQRVNQLKIISDGTLVIASNIGVTRIKNQGDTLAFMPFNPNQNFYSTYDILETRSGDLYIAPDNWMIQKLDTATQKFEDIHYKRLPELSSNYRKQIIEDESGLIWITASYHGLCSYNPQTGHSEIYTAQDNKLSTNVLMGSMNLDREGNIWICTEEEGINIFNIETKTYHHLKSDPQQEGSLNSGHTYTVYFDDLNIAWIGTFDKGINVFNPFQKKFSSTLFEANDLSILKGHSVLDIFEDSRRRVWVGADGGGLFRFEKGKKTLHYTRNDASELLTSNVITALEEDPLGNLLIGTYTGGMISYNIETGVIKKYLADFENHKISSPHVWEIITDSKNRVWLGLLAGGVDQYMYQESRFINFGPYSNKKNKIDFFNVMVIEEDSDGDLWFGTEGKGISILDNETNSVLRIENDSLSNFTTDGVIKCIIQDNWGTIWIGTEDKGLFKYDKRSALFTRYTQENGFIASPVQSLRNDQNGHIWIGTTSGLFNLNPKTQVFTRYIMEDGLSSNDFSPDAMLRLHDGRIMAGTNDGADIISSSPIELNQTIPKVVFTKLSVLSQEVLPHTKINGREILDKSITFTKAFTLNWKDKVFEIDFAALHYTLPQKCQYQYMLEGFDTEWITTTSQRRMAIYSNLDAGTYNFKVRASNNDGKWGDNEASVEITVTPPFWETLAFRIMIVVAFLLAIFLVYKRRIELQKEGFIKKELEQEKKIIALENEKLELELKKLAFNILDKNKMLLEQKNRLLNLSNKAKLSVKEGLHKIVEKIDADMDEEKDWKVIEPQIDKAYNHFISHIKEKHPDLNANEIRIAAYIRMNLSTKEICEFMNKTVRAVENDRYRLRKKIGLELNDSIKEYLINL